MNSLKQYEQRVISTMTFYYKARRRSLSHPQSALLREKARVARSEAFDALNRLKRQETKRGVKL